MAKDTCLAIVVPCFNEGKLIGTTSERLIEVLDCLEKQDKISDRSYILFVDDGSSDDTWLEIGKSRLKHPRKIKAVKFSSNFGNQKALLAGMLKSLEIGCSAVVTIDADLQQDENKIEEFVNKYDEGYKIVCGVRNDRNTDGFFKKITALMFYKFMNILGVKIPKNHSDYRLVSSSVLKVMEQYKETDLFLRGFFYEVGFPKCMVNFDVKPRKVGTSKFNFISLMALAVNGITSYSIVPLKLIAVLGFISTLFGFSTGCWAIIAKILWNDSPNGWAESITLISFFGGIQLFCVGIVGEYLGQIYREVKHRPRYIVEEELI